MAMAISHSSIFILSIFFFSNFFLIQSSNNINPCKNMNTALIKKTCRKIVNTDSFTFSFCLSSLQLATKHSHCTNVRCLGIHSIGLVRHNVTSTRHKIKKLMKKKSYDPYVRMCLSDCLEMYSDALERVKRAIKDYKRKRYVDANFAISAVMTDATTCENGFKEKKGVVSPLTKRNEDVSQLGAIVLGIMWLLR